MRRLFISLVITVWCVSIDAQSDKYMQQSISYQHEAERYTQLALAMDKQVAQFYAQAQVCLRNAESYLKESKDDKVKIYQWKAKCALEQSESYKSRANAARDKAMSYLQEAKNALQNAKK